jgi:uncharacterized pyridoxamine 5'-phosphate oxidase family protein
MDAKTCIQKLKYIASVSMATVDRTGCPQVRTVGIMHVDTEKEELYFLTARGKDFYHELVENKQVQILGLILSIFLYTFSSRMFDLCHIL